MKLAMLKPRTATINTLRIAEQPRTTIDRKRGSAGIKDRNKIKQRDCGVCQSCKADGKVTVGAVVDHKRPLWAGGSDDDSNKWLLCIPCHDSKTKMEAVARASGDAWPFE
jgi:5-methylcytosine-specific restriction protein A